MAQEEGPAVVPEITCQEVVEWASVYLEDHGSDERNRQIIPHLAICAGCETYMKQIATVRDAVQLLPKAEDQPSEPHRLRQAFMARAHRSPSGE